MALPDEGKLSEGDTLELTLTVDGPSGPASVVLQQTLEGGETLLDAANGLVSDLSAVTDDQNNPLGLSGEIVTSDDGVGGIQTSLQIALADGVSLGSVELTVDLNIDVVEEGIIPASFVPVQMGSMIL